MPRRPWTLFRASSFASDLDEEWNLKEVCEKAIETAAKISAPEETHAQNQN
jgi:hypothetical protein